VPIRVRRRPRGGVERAERHLPADERRRAGLPTRTRGSTGSSLRLRILAILVVVALFLAQLHTPEPAGPGHHPSVRGRPIFQRDDEHPQREVGRRVMPSVAPTPSFSNGRNGGPRPRGSRAPMPRESQTDALRVTTSSAPLAATPGSGRLRRARMPSSTAGERGLQLGPVQSPATGHALRQTVGIDSARPRGRTAVLHTIATSSHASLMFAYEAVSVRPSQ
jgi:hypothetical protein